MGSAVCKLKTRPDSRLVRVANVFENWVKEDPFLLQVCMKAIKHCTALQEEFGIENSNGLNAESAYRVTKMTESMKTFFAICIEYASRGQLAQFKNYCKDIGSHHALTSKKYLQTSYFDMFIWAMTDTLERSEKRPDFEDMVAWQKFLRAIVDSMREGYELQLIIDKLEENKVVRFSNVTIIEFNRD